jgi:hypothetical protein
MKMPLKAPIALVSRTGGVPAIGLWIGALLALSCGSSTGPTIATRDPNREVDPTLISIVPASGTHVPRGVDVPVTLTVVYRFNELNGYYLLLSGSHCVRDPPIPGQATYCSGFIGAPNTFVPLEPESTGRVTTTSVSGILHVPEDLGGQILIQLTWGTAGGFTNGFQAASYPID